MEVFNKLIQPKSEKARAKAYRNRDNGAVSLKFTNGFGGDGIKMDISDKNPFMVDDVKKALKAKNVKFKVLGSYLYVKYWDVRNYVESLEEKAPPKKQTNSDNIFNDGTGALKKDSKARPEKSAAKKPVGFLFGFFLGKRQSRK